MNDSIEVLKNKISQYEYILDCEKRQVARTKNILKGLIKELALKELEELK